MHLQKAAAIFRKRFGESIDGLLPIADLFDNISDILIFVKDRNFRYVAVNETFASRCGLPDKFAAIGHTARELYPEPLAEAFLEQDKEILATGVGFHDRLEMHLYPGGRSGWCLTYKEPIRGKDGTIIGICGCSRDLAAPADKAKNYDALSKTVDFIHRHYDEPLRLPQLAEMAGLSVYQFDQRIRSLFHLTAGQYLVKVRIDAACEQLASTKEPVAQIALACGYSDQSAFSRQFKQAVGVSPLAYRKRMEGS
ncbi:transcriptional regulator [Haloferula helveola]|uniref:Transcriptional regulator n=1 Tax=Haloferula helveola TaxID=490095 RepID=A0ABN6H5S0_9BACT|nr:transcriptional regulator [Haloferula helveola]